MIVVAHLTSRNYLVVLLLHLVPHLLLLQVLLVVAAPIQFNNVVQFI
jgi:hypothetical protein